MRQRKKSTYIFLAYIKTPPRHLKLVRGTPIMQVLSKSFCLVKVSAKNSFTDKTLLSQRVNLPQ
nr:MAG TPA: hypothetical protein [Caudoviricetes sp.]